MNNSKEYFVLAQHGHTVQLRRYTSTIEPEPQQGDLFSKHTGQNHQTWMIVKVFEEHEEKILRGLIFLIEFVRLQRLMTFQVFTTEHTPSKPEQ